MFFNAVSQQLKFYTAKFGQNFSIPVGQFKDYSVNWLHYCRGREQNFISSHVWASDEILIRGQSLSSSSPKPSQHSTRLLKARLKRTELLASLICVQAPSASSLPSLQVSLHQRRRPAAWRPLPLQGRS